MIADDLIVLVAREIMGLSSKFDPDNYVDAVDAAERDTGWTMPVTTSFKIKWMIQRTKRALFFMLLTGEAKKVKYEQISLEQAFGHYRTLIKDMDDEFKEAKKEDPYEFASVESYQMFGTKIDAGFQYDPITGGETTYTNDNTIIINPNEYDETE